MHSWSFIGKAATSFKGNLMIIGLPFATTTFLGSLWPEIALGTLTLGRALHGAFVCVIGSMVGTLFVWYVLLRPFIRSRGLPGIRGREDEDG
jgi:hypothetical protein